MNGISGFQELRSSTSRISTNRLLREQRIYSEKASGTFSILKFALIDSQAAETTEWRASLVAYTVQGVKWVLQEMMPQIPMMNRLLHSSFALRTSNL
jgi:hypothetical protein